MQRDEAAHIPYTSHMCAYLIDYTPMAKCWPFRHGFAEHTHTLIFVVIVAAGSPFIDFHNCYLDKYTIYVEYTVFKLSQQSSVLVVFYYLLFFHMMHVLEHDVLWQYYSFIIDACSSMIAQTFSSTEQGSLCRPPPYLAHASQPFTANEQGYHLSGK